MATIERTIPVAKTRYTGLLEWVTTVDHKKIGILYLGTSFFFFLTGGLLARGIRTQLAGPDGQILTAQQYNAAFTMHGVEPSVPASPTPLAPSGLTGVGVHVACSSKRGKSVARGSA